MEKNGTGFIVHENGWACSNDVMFDVERDIYENEEGKKFSRETKTLKFNCIFDGRGVVKNNILVHCLFRSEGKVFGFTGEIKGRSGDLTVVKLLTKSEKIKELILKIKGGN